MTRCFWGKLFPIILLGSTLTAVADSVTTLDDQTIAGKIIKIHEGKMEIETTFSDNIIINMDMVKSFHTEADVRVKTEGDQQLKGVVVSEPGGINVTDGMSKANLDGSKVKVLWMPGDIAPDYVEPFKKEWKFKAGADWLKKTGNTVEDNLAADFVATLEDLDDTMKLYGRYTWKTTNDEKTDDELIAGVDYEKRYKNDSSWYVRGEFERDEFEQIDMRTTIAGGYGYYFNKRENLKLRGRVGLFMRHESYVIPVDTYETFGLDLGLHFTYTRPKQLEWYTDINWTPSLEDFSQYRLTHESAVSLPIANSNWSFKLGIRQEYNTEATINSASLDNTYFSRLELNF